MRELARGIKRTLRWAVHPEEGRLERAEAIIDLQKKLALLLGLPTANDGES